MRLGSFYDSPVVETLKFSAIDFGDSSDTTRVIAVPRSDPTEGLSTGRGKRGRVLGARVHNVTEAFNGSTSVSAVQVGDGSDADKYFDTGLKLGDTVTAATGEVDINTGQSYWFHDDGAQVDIEAGRDTVTVTFVACVGSPTGIADVDLVVAWY